MRHFHYPNRSLAVAGEAMVATSHPLATLTAIETLKSGGNAVDAAIAASARPDSTRRSSTDPWQSPTTRALRQVAARSRPRALF